MKTIEGGLKVHIETKNDKSYYYIFSADNKRACYTLLDSPLVYLIAGETLTETYKDITPRWCIPFKLQPLALDWVEYNILPKEHAISVH